MRATRDITQALYTFLQSLITEEKPDLIVCSERKATAILRALIEELPDHRIQWEWSKVLSTTALQLFDWSSLSGRKVLLFDELVHHGNTLKRNEESLLRAAGGCDLQLVTAGFAVWDRCEHRPDHSYHGAVDSKKYEEIREDIIFMLQEHGSLLLDTEHVELSVRVQCGVREFYDALATAAPGGHSFSFVSGAGRTNLTIDHPDVIWPEGLSQFLVPGSNIEGAVCKVRVLEKTHEVFSILPIFYPNVRCVPEEQWVSLLPGFVKRSLLRDPTPQQVFYTVALLVAVELLRPIVSSLNDLRKNKVILDFDKKKLLHLKAMFPGVDTDLLHQYVYDIIANSERVKLERTKYSVGVENIPEEKLLALCDLVIRRLVERTTGVSEGLSWQQMTRLAEDQNAVVNLPPSSVTVVVDRLIDSGLVVTGTRDVLSSGGEPFVIRTFAPEGEIVSAKIRQEMMAGGPQCQAI